ncbi:MAG: SAM-dependent chlorinase/fluorinase [Candidatus Melainabacteria bacterium]|nr:SAM-dependent chlorinase/fluorinase [Candidatus Melainabacteria bacterium]
MSKKLLHVICDYKLGDQAYSEVLAALYRYLPDDVVVVPSSVESFDTVSTGFTLAQLALAPENIRPHETFVFANCAPRKDELGSRSNNKGEKLVFGYTVSGVRFAVVNSGFSLSFVRKEIVELYALNVEDGTSQFRSRDVFPKAVASLLSGDKHLLKEQLSLEDIPLPPAGAVGYIDSFGNIKTTIRVASPLGSLILTRQTLEIKINSETHIATSALGSFSVAHGQLAFAPGSSGHSDRYFEIFLRGGSAAALFGYPESGSAVELAFLD